MIRIVGGRFRGRRLLTPRGAGTRPALEAHRSVLMNVLGPDLSGAAVLDLFAGSGAFGLECVSRGAARAVLVERSRTALAAIRGNVAALSPGPEVVRVLPGDAYALPPLGERFDIVFVAPPYPHFLSERERLLGLLGRLPGLLAEGGDVVVQSAASGFEGWEVPGLLRGQVKRLGATDFTFLRSERA